MLLRTCLNENKIFIGNKGTAEDEDIRDHKTLRQE